MLIRHFVASFSSDTEISPHAIDSCWGLFFGRMAPPNGGGEFLIVFILHAGQEVVMAPIIRVQQGVEIPRFGCPRAEQSNGPALPIENFPPDHLQRLSFQPAELPLSLESQL